ncbi:MlaD family protein [Caenimonas koreensis]|uniref:Mammalian cell entry protein n=1 Tax=Caenimonas koreensis DSM 17982 TaxID=1121255 RepID=A0A844B4Y6_9BURK|nr:mammalian cell entry protein [Caenimonas koreensis]MRD48283.1 mammalian cell entry protein [Caenimonas koreensis DSM 17982]
MSDLPNVTPLAKSEPAAQPVAHLEFKAALLLIFTVVLIAGSILFLLHARGAFEPTQSLVLVTDDSEGVIVGMDMTFSGFPIGRVRKVELAKTGNVNIVVDVAKKDAHWLRTTSVFTLVHGLVGGTTIKAYSGILTDPPLPDDAERPVLRGDATAELPRVLAAARETLENMSAMTAQDAALRTSIANLREVTERMKGPRGALGAVFGNETDAQKLVTALERANTLLARLDAMAGKADAQVFGPEGVMKDARASMQQLNALLTDTRASLKKVDAVLVEAQGISSNVRGATTDLGALRADVEANLRKVEGMINELNRKWPFAKDTEVKLP